MYKAVAHFKSISLAECASDDESSESTAHPKGVQWSGMVRVGDFIELTRPSDGVSCQHQEERHHVAKVTPLRFGSGRSTS